MIDQDLLVWMRCPYSADLCGADAELVDVEILNDGWSGRLMCINGHEFVLSQIAIIEEQV